jgi:acetyl esterase/lipase
VRRTAAALALVAVLAAACGGDETAERERFVVGSGAESATVFVPGGDPRGRLGVVFLHGWGVIEPGEYGAWIGHLVARGHVVIAPRYQDTSSDDGTRALARTVSGVRAALERLPGVRGLVAAGHSAGGALAADLAAVARRERLPPLQAVLAVYPGRALSGVFAMPAVDLGAVPAATRIEALAGDDDPVVGTAPARRLAREADGRYVLIRDDAVDDHTAPLRADAAARAAFWARLDRLIRSVDSG